MSTMTEQGVNQSPHDALGGQLTQDGQYPGLLDVSNLKQSTVPLFSQHLLTVEQLLHISVDADIQTSVDSFLKGLTNQMFARIVRNGSAEVGNWLGAKVQSERDGWTAMLRMAMENIEFHRKSALQGQVVLHNTLEQLMMLVDCFQVHDDVKREIQEHENDLQGIRTCLQILAECCNTLMEDRFQCVQILGCSDHVPTMLSTLLQGLKDKLQQTETEKKSLEEQLSEAVAETSRLHKVNEQCLEEVRKTEDKMKQKQEDLEVLKTQLKEIDKMVKFRKYNTAEKCVGTTLELFTTSAKPPPSSSGMSKFRSTEDLSTMAWASRDHVHTQAIREPSMIELSEEKLRLLKERAKKLESSLKGAITSMDKLRKNTPAKNNRSKPPPSTSTSTTFNTAMFVAVPTHRNTKTTPKSWVSTSFQVSNTVTSSVTASVPKLGHFQPTERRCFSERPAGGKPGAGDEQEGKLASAGKSKGDSRKGNRNKTNGSVSKCLRCRQLFTCTDNHKLACCFHSKGKERVEVYSDGGQLVRVHYVWKCCQQQGDTDGCCYGHHV